MSMVQSRMITGYRATSRGRRMLTWVIGVAAGLATVALTATAATPPYGETVRVAPKAFLDMPRSIEGTLPQRLSQTGAFSDLASLTPSPGLVPYDLIVPFWSDGATKQRFMAVPKGGKIRFSATGDWEFPPGTVFVKTFELATDADHPQSKRRLETRLLVVGQDGVYGVTYKWRPDNSDADLLPAEGQQEPIEVHGAAGSGSQKWIYPSRKDCLTCHNIHTSGVLGLKTRQLNRDFSYPSGVTDNEIRTLNHLGLFESKLPEAEIPSLPRLAATDDTRRSLEDRARSYLDANCGHCHRPGGTVAYFDARYETPLVNQQLIDGPILINQGIDRPHPISPHDIWRSIIYMRADTNGDIRMPPIARATVDTRGMALLKQWIESLPGKDVLAPPAIKPDGGTFSAPVEVTLSSPDAGAQIHYTLDGSVPGPTDPLYDKPLKLDSPTVVRARAYQDGHTRSIVAEQPFIIGSN